MPQPSSPTNSSPEKEEKKKWKDLKMMKKLERQRAQEEQAKRQEEEEAAAQSSDQGKRWVLGRTQEVACGLPSHLICRPLSFLCRSLLCFLLLFLSFPSFLSLPLFFFPFQVRG